MCTNFLLNYLILKLVAESPLEPCATTGGKGARSQMLTQQVVSRD